ncbi:HlyD family secretion protein [Acuticoccus sp. M5D2P5]|uniref:HlyD family secretion protein n=1 Tax=Acuticoccus kalidii TaxID=2910977 RepID=UPI001F23521E|nr:HlyD family secretion protein [Acuticoccus kalidii]MCF3935674.1 HlyD family secretion protein [Acuticoccus kalidii]
MQLHSEPETFEDLRTETALDRTARQNTSADAPPPSGRNETAPRPEPASLESRPTVAAPSDEAPPAAPPTAEPAPPKPRRKRLVLFAIIAIALAAGAYEGHHWWTVGRFEVSTDDAYLGADMSILAAKVSGYVTEVPVEDNQHVTKGEVIARIDDGDYRLAVQSAQDRIDVQSSTIERIGVQIDAAQAGIDEATANIDSAQASLEFANAELDRKSKLAKSDFASKQAVENARAERDKARASVAAAKAAHASAVAAVSVLEAERAEAQATLNSLQTALQQAERDLSFTIVRAPVDGVVGNRAVEVGELVQSGTRLAAIVPLSSVYIDANFKETQLETMHPGQRASVTIDAYPDRIFEGEVASIAPASGALFSLLPPQNATGNFTKIVQRLPVRIELSEDAVAEGILRPGMSAVVTVDRRTDAPQSAALAPGSAHAAEAPAQTGRRTH